MPIAAAVVAGVAAVGGAVASSDAARKQSNAAKDAANAQNQTTQQSLALQQKNYQQMRSDLAPYRGAGQTALNNYMSLLGLPVTQGMVDGTSNAQGEMMTLAPPPEVDRMVYHYGTKQWDQKGYDAARAQYLQQKADYDQKVADAKKPVTQGLMTTDDLTKLPGYQFQMQQGTQAVENSAAARGLQLSSANLKDLMKYGQGLASGAYQQQLNNLQSLWGAGQNAAAMSGAGAMSTGNNMSQTMMAGTAAANNANLQGANASAAGTMGVANALTGAANQYTNYATSQQTLKQMFPNGVSGGSTPSYNPATGGSINNYQPGFSGTI